MINATILNDLYANLEVWFDDYIHGFENQYPQYLPEFKLKRTHSHKVADEIIAISRAAGFKSKDRLLAKIVGFLHDIGRFP